MASGEIDVTPGRVLSSTEVLDNGKLNDLGRPILRVKEAAITSRELAPGSIDADKLNVHLEAQLGVANGSVTTAKIVDGAVTSAKLSSDAAFPTGGVLDFAGTTAPEGWLLCYGQEVSRSTYSVLFTVIGTTHGNGDGSSTFNIPDLRGRVAAGKDDMGGVSANRFTAPNGGVVNGNILGGVGGLDSHTLTIIELPSHTHYYDDYYQATSIAGGGGSMQFGNDVHLTESAATTPRSTNAEGYSGAHNNTQPTIILNKIIKAT